ATPLSGGERRRPGRFVVSIALSSCRTGRPSCRATVSAVQSPGRLRRRPTGVPHSETGIPIEVSIHMSEQYIYVMKDLRKIYPPNREVLKGIWLSFFPGAKIGVVGLNGAGKSTLLKIMAGLVTDFGGEAWAAKGARVGYLAQEPLLDPGKDVLGNVEEGVAETRALLTRFDEINAKFGEPMSTRRWTSSWPSRG